MGRESCNLDKEEAELLNSSSPSSASSTRAAAAPPSLFLKPATQRTPETPAVATDPGNAGACVQERSGEQETPPPWRSAGRCSSCQRRVGLTAFRCRCGDLFCSRHRHADAHDCSFDYKAAGREEISRANPLVRAAKILKI